MYSNCLPPRREEMRRWRHAHPTTHVTSPMATAQLRGSKHQKGTMPATGDGGVARHGVDGKLRVEGRYLSIYLSRGLRRAG